MSERNHSFVQKPEKNIQQKYNDAVIVKDLFNSILNTSDELDIVHTSQFIGHKLGRGQHVD